MLDSQPSSVPMGGTHHMPLWLPTALRSPQQNGALLPSSTPPHSPHKLSILAQRESTTPSCRQPPPSDIVELTPLLLPRGSAASVHGNDCDLDRRQRVPLLPLSSLRPPCSLSFDGIAAATARQKSATSPTASVDPSPLGAVLLPRASGSGVPDADATSVGVAASSPSPELSSVRSWSRGRSTPSAAATEALAAAHGVVDADGERRSERRLSPALKLNEPSPSFVLAPPPPPFSASDRNQKYDAEVRCPSLPLPVLDTATLSPITLLDETQRQQAIVTESDRHMAELEHQFLLREMELTRLHRHAAEVLLTPPAAVDRTHVKRFLSSDVCSVSLGAAAFLVAFHVMASLLETTFACALTANVPMLSAYYCHSTR